MQVPFAKPAFTEADGAAVAEAVASGWVSQGPRVQAFEKAYAARVGAPDAVATTNCTTALHLALYVSGVGPGDEVIVPSISFIATANAVWQCGATPVFADIDPKTYNLDPASAEQAITPATKAIMPVHQIGLPADMDAFLALGEQYGLAIVEDSACAVGSSYKGRPIGSLGPLSCFSLHPRKVITTGEGGMIAVHDPEVAARLRRLRQHAMDVSDLARHNANDVVIESYPERGWNCRMTDIQAALGLRQLEVLDDILAERRRQAERYNEALAAINGIETPYDPPYAIRTWQSYAVRVVPEAGIERTELMRQLLHDGIATRRGVMAIHHEASYPEPLRAPLPHSDEAAANALMLPLFPGLTDEQQDYVVERVAFHVARSQTAAPQSVAA
jgi:dTDP-4-amino-4,6-dideoxygalactose transaminase